MATTILSRFVSYMFCTFISQYMLDVEFGIEKRRGYIYIYADFVIEAQGGYMCL